MNEHTRVSDLLPLYVSGGLDRDQHAAVEKHLAACAECQEDLTLWKAAAREIMVGDQAIAAPQGLADRALAQVQQSPMRFGAGQGSTITAKLRRAGQLFASQAPLVQREIWPASAAVIGLGTIAALIAAHSGFVYALAPLIAAACVSLIYGPENDPAFELTLSTPTSPRQILLARLALVFGYNLGLVLIATLSMLPFLRQPLFGHLLLAWLAPMTFLSAAALVLSLWIGAPNAISITYTAWLVQLLAGPLRSPQAGINLSPAALDILTAYQRFWQAPALLLALSAALFVGAVWLAGRREHGLLNLA